MGTLSGQRQPAYASFAYFYVETAASTARGMRQRRIEERAAATDILLSGCTMKHLSEGRQHGTAPIKILMRLATMTISKAKR